jgi:hypothetical protein
MEKTKAMDKTKIAIACQGGGLKPLLRLVY